MLTHSCLYINQLTWALLNQNEVIKKHLYESVWVEDTMLICHLFKNCFLLFLKRLQSLCYSSHHLSNPHFEMKYHKILAQLTPKELSIFNAILSIAPTSSHSLLAECLLLFGYFFITLVLASICGLFSFKKKTNKQEQIQSHPFKHHQHKYTYKLLS